MDKKLDKHSAEQKTPVPTQEPIVNKPDFTAVKEKIITEIKEQSGSLNRHYDEVFKAANQDIKTVNGNILKVFDVVSQIRKQQREAAESQEASGHFFNFRLFKVNIFCYCHACPAGAYTHVVLHETAEQLFAIIR